MNKMVVSSRYLAFSFIKCLTKWPPRWRNA